MTFSQAHIKNYHYDTQDNPSRGRTYMEATFTKRLATITQTVSLKLDALLRTGLLD